MIGKLRIKKNVGIIQQDNEKKLNINNKLNETALSLVIAGQKLEEEILEEEILEDTSKNSTSKPLSQKKIFSNRFNIKEVKEDWIKVNEIPVESASESESEIEEDQEPIADSKFSRPVINQNTDVTFNNKNIEYNADNIHLLLYHTDEKFTQNEHNIFIRTVRLFIREFNKYNCKEVQKILAKLLYEVICQNKNILNSYPTLAVQIFKKINDFILKDEMYELIPSYNKIFNDKRHDLLSSDKLSEQHIDSVKDQLLQIIAERKFNHKLKKPKFKKGEIVGAQDKEGKWWLSEVLEVIQYGTHILYYITFKGWGDKFNEFIEEGYRIRYFNPKRHKYYRSAEIT